MINWCVGFGLPSAFMANGPMHFNNKTLGLLRKRLSAPHRFILPYSRWSNGAVKRLGKALLQMAQAILSELQIDFEEWHDIVLALHFAVDSASSSCKAKEAAITAFKVMTPTPLIKTVYR